jgi:hypothetical protein
MPDFQALGLREFLRAHPKMALRPADGNELNIEGRFDFRARTEKYHEINDGYVLRIRVPSLFPRDVPAVYEVERRIPRNGHYHVNSDGTLCLGSRLRVLQKLARLPTLTGFSQNCLVPYLFAVSHKLTYGGDLPFGELAHGPAGELMDYLELFGLRTVEQARMVVQYLGMKERKANKLPCPCGCGRRLGRCRFNMKLREFRRLAERSWFRSIL